MRGNILHNSHVDYTDYLEDELTRFPKGKHDDLIDALSYAVSASYPPRQGKKENIRSKYLY